ncbi:MAG: prolipoprotein diacylglyceryl transferase family protein [Planctomycetota bacterium]
MHPVLLKLPGLDFPIRTFGALVAAGILVAIWIWGKALAKYGDDPKQDPERASQAALWVVVGVLAGARLFYVAVETMRYLRAGLSEEQVAWLDADPKERALVGAKLTPELIEGARKVSVGHDFLGDPLKVVMIWQGGLVMYGGLIGGILLGLHAARKSGLNPWNALDTGLASGFIGLLFGRIGCLMVGDDYGRVVPESFAASARPLVLPNGGEIGFLTIRVPQLDWLLANSESLFEHDLAGKVLWATQPWMSLNALLCAAAGFLWLRGRKHYGVPAALMLMQYAVSRFTIEVFRGDEVRGLWFGGSVSTSQLVSIVIFVLGAWLLVRRRATPTLTPR